jgi:hypothetical protein
MDRLQKNIEEAALLQNQISGEAHTWRKRSRGSGKTLRTTI